MIIRIWHGWTTPENAAAYENLLKSEVFKGIADKSIAGYEKIELVRRDLGDEVEFVTIMRFKSLDAVRAVRRRGLRTALTCRRKRARSSNASTRVRNTTNCARRSITRHARLNERDGDYVVA